jgi:TetR/AcrR family transcriptional regulator
MVHSSNSRSISTGNERIRMRTEAGLSPGNLYHYFNGKHELHYFCQDRSLDQMLAALRVAQKSKLSPRAQVASVLVAHALCLIDEMEGSAAHLEVDALPPELRTKIVKKRDRYERGIRQLVSSGIRDHVFEPCDPTLVTRAMLGAINWTAGWFRPDGPDPAPKVANALTEFLLRGLEGKEAHHE